MPRSVPAATATLHTLRFLSSQATPVSAARIAKEVGLPRSTAYRLLTTMSAEDFVVHYPEERTWGIGMAAWEVGNAFAQQAPLARLARVPLARLVDAAGQSAHLAVLQGNDIVYVLEERAPGRSPLVSDVGVRLPAHLTASGRAILATLSRAQVNALYPTPESFVSRTGRGPLKPSHLRSTLVQTRQRGFGMETHEVTEGFASVAVAISSATVRASVAITWETYHDTPIAPLVEAAQSTATVIASRLGGRNS